MQKGFALLRCSCKEVLRRDKAAAITIEPRGNSLPTCYTHVHAHACACATRPMRDLGARAFFFARFNIYTDVSRECVCEKIRGCTSDMEMDEKKKKGKKINARRQDAFQGKYIRHDPRAFCALAVRSVNIKPRANSFPEKHFIK